MAIAVTAHDQDLDSGSAGVSHQSRTPSTPIPPRTAKAEGRSRSHAREAARPVHRRGL
jgi:hypothetical protein